MPSPPKPAEQSRTWAVTLIRKKGDFLGTVDAPDLPGAEQAAAEKFGLTPAQVKRLAITPLRGS